MRPDRERLHAMAQLTAAQLRKDLIDGKELTAEHLTDAIYRLSTDVALLVYQDAMEVIGDARDALEMAHTILNRLNALVGQPRP